jgi:hypothetical protein
VGVDMGLFYLIILAASIIVAGNAAPSKAPTYK